MSTATQTLSASPARRLFPHISPPKAVINIIASRRHSSTVDLNANTGSGTPGQRRTVSTPATNDKSDTESDAVEESRAAENPRSATKTSSGLHQLTFPHAAKIFVKLRRMQKKVKAHHTDSNSGDEPVTNQSLLDANGQPDITKKHARLEIQDDYVCSDGVDLAKLLRATRAALLNRASPLHANVLIDEQWSCSICGPKHRADGTYRVHIRYTATAATSPKREPSQPIALEKASGIPGLMTIAQRETVGLTVVELFEDVQISQS